MRLKRVTIFGFKTFADRTEFEVESALTAVVGSNGCGKSNIVDAILWGLGEASPRHIRAASGVDVIFNGSAHRKPLGFAEVTLLFDNEDGSLPIEAAEVSVTRRLTRSGDAEYRINKSACRQRDVFELFADSGLGRTGYAIVGQKEIDSALSASPEDRRTWLDEAAGVQRYRARKTEAQRRLMAAKTHLERTSDLISELEVQQEPLKDEAEVAHQYKTTLNSLRQVETGLLIQELRKAVDEIAIASERWQSASKLYASESSRTDQLDADLKGVTAELQKMETELEAARASHSSSAAAYERLAGDARLAQHRLDSLREMQASLGEEVASSENRTSEAQQEFDQALAEVRSEEADFEALRKDNAGSEEAAAKLSAELKVLESELGEARRIEQLRQKRALETSHRQERTREVERELKGIRASEPEMASALADSEHEESAALKLVEDLRATVASLHTRLSEWQKSEDESATRVRAALAERAGLEGRIQGVEATIFSHEGLAQGPRAVLDAASRGELDGEFLPVGEAITAGEGVSLAIETALGGAVNDLIVDSDESAKGAVLWLKENRAGRATFQPVSSVRPRDPGQEFKRLLAEAGVVGSASELLECAPRHRPVLDSLLNRVLVVETLDDALRISRTSGRPYRRVVTLGGELVDGSGAITGGTGAKQSYGLVQRKSELTKLRRQLDKVAAVVENAESDAVVRGDNRASAAAELAESLAGLKEADVAAMDARRFASAIREETQAALKMKSRLERELSELKQESEPLLLPAVDAAAIEARRHDLLKGLAATSADADGLEARLVEAEQRLIRARARHEIAERRLANVTAGEEQRARRLENIGPDLIRLSAEVERITKEVARSAKLGETAEARLQGIQGQRRDLSEQSVALSEAARDARESLQALSESSHHAELQRTRAEGRRIAAVERLLEEYGIGEEDALRAPIEVLPADAAALVHRLRKDLRAMGDVNVGAIEAYERLSTRLEELSSQRSDILDGISDVESTIAELDGLTKDRFVQTYEAVRRHFAGIVNRLFGGGEGILELSDPQAVLDSGIEIAVTLPGKKRQQLGLLSGGERSLCAMAFLFALLEVKCSPLVVLDEVDAPLDGVNVERFAALLNDYSQRTQFIVITHNRETIAASPMWLGVTMQEPGVSTLIPYREARPEAVAGLASITG